MAKAPQLGPKATAAGYRLAAFDTIGSTNTEGMARARDGDPGRLWLYSEEQTAGRGRRGRAWSTPHGNMAASFMTVTSLPPATAATLGFVAGIALCDAIAPLLAESPVRDGSGRLGGPAPSARLRLKWPNDVLHGGSKLAGILLEAERLPGGRMAVVVGIGVNVLAAPEGLPYPATALAALGVPVTAAELFARLTDAWIGIERAWDEGRGLGDILGRWLDRAAGLGEPVAVTVGDTVLRGTFETVDAEGRLVIRAADGTRRTIAAGEVQFGAAATHRSES